MVEKLTLEDLGEEQIAKSDVFSGIFLDMI